MYSGGVFCTRISASTRRCTWAAPDVARSMFSRASLCASGSAATAAVSRTATGPGARRLSHGGFQSGGTSVIKSEGRSSADHWD
jgi:hypothetical protein